MMFAAQLFGELSLQSEFGLNGAAHWTSSMLAGVAQDSVVLAVRALIGMEALIGCAAGEANSPSEP